jgi:hypothetical protein
MGLVREGGPLTVLPCTDGLALPSLNEGGAALGD